MSKYFTGVVVIILIALGVWMWGGSKKETKTGAPIRIGALISQTGVAAQFGEMSKKGIDLAVDEINKAGGVDGRMVEVVYEDDRTDPKAAAGLYQKFTSVDHVDAIIGSNFDFVTQPVFALAKTGNVVVITPSSPRIAGAFDTNEMSFTMMSDFSKMVGTMSSYLDKESWKKIAVVRFESAFGAEITKTLNTLSNERGKGNVVDETYKQIGNNDFRTTVLKLKNAGVDVVFLDMIGPDPATFLSQAKAIGFNPKYVIHTGLADALAAKGADPKVFEGFTVLNWEVSTDAYKEKFRARYTVQPTNSSNRAYDAVYVLAEAVAKSADTKSVAAYLGSHTFTTPNGQFAFSADHAGSMTPVRLEKFTNGTYVAY